MHTATDYTNRPAPHFPATGRCICIGNTTTGRWSYVYGASEEAKAWDGAEGATHTVGSRHGGYNYVKIVTKGAPKYVAAIEGMATRCRITVAINTEDEETINGWIKGAETFPCHG